ncbi:Pyridoxal 5'-phosphate synthase subunit PdxT [Lamellibrachia satsuma]|nr:Pyridoxal 5'-phosphate synthase subunit PdxT [Lamellibrachia satsuma]
MSVGAAVRVGILAVQGDFVEHEESFRTAGRAEDCAVAVVRVRCPADLVGLDGLVLPGGESTVMAGFLHRHGLVEAVLDWMHGDHQHRRQIWGTCAGLILLADKVFDNTLSNGHGPGQGSTPDLETSQKHDIDAPRLLGGLSISVVRNLYGGQRDSFETDVFISSELDVLNNDNKKTKVAGASCRGIFIRAPGIQSVNSNEVTVLATIATEHGEQVVAVEQANVLGTTFHPELTDDTRWHRYFLKRTRDAARDCYVT